ncbi:MAG TPA: beta-ketoacyl synthase N-terminal-like domain-containing protein [Granulicella sp.]|nr:beta-ketoacyl synthase N-terminal-like domain-containing protein [Granulicella sp.]
MTHDHRFAPIAIVGQACYLPGAHSPDELWRAVVERRDLITSVPRSYWRLSEENNAAHPAIANRSSESIATDRGGHVVGFEDVFDPHGFAVPAAEIAGLDPLCHWILQAGRDCLHSAGMQIQTDGGPSTITSEASLLGGMVIGNLSYPSAGLAEHAERHWLGLDEGDPRNRFCSGFPIQFAARALGLRLPSFGMDAACASSLYAIKLACNRLHAGEADFMVAGGVNRADNLFLHMGFQALGASSKTGQSRPFHRDADGLIPSEGIALVALKRLADAEAAGDNILGVIRGIGLSNDGRAQGLLVPSAEGQVRAMLQAYQGSGLQPSDIQLVECHATGTPLGDAIEIDSMTRVFGMGTGGHHRERKLPIGSLKSNMGHLITAAGAAALIKVLAAFQHQTLPPTCNVEDELESIAGSPFRLLTEAEPWDATGPRRAAISAFGFGGNNAHLLVEEWTGTTSDAELPTAPPEEAIAIVSIATLVGELEDVAAFARATFGDSYEAAAATLTRHSEQICIPGSALRFPPHDLERALPQQMLVLRAAIDAVAEAGRLPKDRTSVLVGMQCDAEIARCGARWRLPDLPKNEGATEDSFHPELAPATVVGTMPNIVANRINSQFDFKGPSFAVFSEELSGMTALELGMRALQSGEIDAALVGAVDMSCEPAHEAAALHVFEDEERVSGDAAIMFVLKRVTDAERDGNRIYAILPQRAPCKPSVERSHSAPPLFGETPSGIHLAARFGHAHAASGLLHVAAAALACYLRAMPCQEGKPGYPWLPVDGPRQAQVQVRSFTGEIACVLVEQSLQAPGTGWLVPAKLAPQIRCFSGENAQEILVAILSGHESTAGPARLCWVAADHAEDGRQRDHAIALLRSVPTSGEARLPYNCTKGMYFRPAPLHGELAFVYTFAAAAYAGMGRQLLLGLPELLEGLGERFEGALANLDWIYAGDSKSAPQPSHMDQLRGFSLLCHAHTHLTRDFLKLHPAAAIGISSGESSALFCMGAWERPEQMFREIEDSGLYSRELAGEFRAVERAWGALGHHEPVRWICWRIFLPIEEVQAVVANHALAHILLIHSPEDCLIGGSVDACDHVIEALGHRHCLKVEAGMAAHCPEVGEFAEEWRVLHHRATKPVPGVRFYSNANNTHYALGSDAVADAILGQALTTVDYPTTILNAWNDGVRIFLEHGPWGLCADWIAQTLKGREHLVLSLDRAGESPIQQVLDVAAQLLTAGVPAESKALVMRLQARQDHASLPARSNESVFKFRGHLPRVNIRQEASRKVAAISQNEAPAQRPRVQTMAPAPHVPLSTTLKLNEFPRLGDMPPAASTAAAIPVAISSAPSAVPFHAPAVVQLPLRQADTQGQSGQFWGSALLQHHAFVHQQWMQTQVTMQQLFLESRQRMLAAVSGMSSGLVVDPAVTSFEPQQTFVISAPAAAVPEASSAPAPKSVSPPHIEAPSLPPAPTPIGPAFSRQQLETLSQGKISSVFGESFVGQDHYARQVRMPMPPLLLADRVTGIDAEPHILGTGTIWTETDVCHDSWYLHEGRMPAGIMIESGQADLLLISWMGADALNQGERVYRLLGCELTYHRSLPQVGDTLVYDIHVDGHAQQDGIRLFFFHYDCRVNGQLRLSVRRGQAGFFNRDELDDSMGILWDPATAAAPPPGMLDAPAVPCTFSSFTKEQVQAFSLGNAFACFGPGFEMAQTHTRTPRIQSGDMLLFDEVTHFDPKGGPWGRGYLRAVLHIQPDHWFFKGHFKNDPCMPGTLMFEGCLQAMAMYLAAMGYTLDRDGWRFEPVPEEKVQLSCRGQVLPTAKQVVCELFVREVSAGPLPTLHTDLLGTVDGLRAFHAQNMGFRLVPDWPLTTRTELLENYRESKTVAQVDGFQFGYPSLLACAWGKPTDAFGQMYRGFDGVRRIARLPGPPYHFMTRVTKLEGEMGIPKAGAYAELEYDIPKDVWYFEENGSRTMPFCVLLEAALQPCGWLASYLGCSLGNDEDLAFRNLDGTGTSTIEIRPGAKCLVTKVKVTQVSGAGGMIILGFDVHCELDGAPAYNMTTVFGFFPGSSLKNQAGLPLSAEQRLFLEAPSDFSVDLRTYPERYFQSEPRLPASRLLMIDRITGYWPGEGAAKLCKLRGEKDVTHNDWFFKAHFFQDPVQPGSLGLEALLQLLQFYMLHEGLGANLEHPRFELIMLDEPMTWKYRGQVTPESRKIVSEMEIIESGSDERGAFVLGNGNLYVDGKRIYQAARMGMRIVAGERPTPRLDIRPFWRQHVKTEYAPLENLFQTLVDQFVHSVVVTAPAALDAVANRGVLYLGNHQSQIESMLFLVAVSALRNQPIIALANAKHRHRWLGELIAACFSLPGMTDPELIRYFEQSRPECLPEILAELGTNLAAGERSVLIHVEGTRQTSCRQSVKKISAALIDLALNANVPIVPVRFTRGLPVEPLLSGKLEFPIGYGGQNYYIGEPIPPSELRSLSLLDQKQRILTAIQALGPASGEETPAPPDLALIRTVKLHMQEMGLDEVKAMLSIFSARCGVAEHSDGSPEQQAWSKAWKTWLGAPSA